jgi:hypothetical protein
MAYRRGWNNWASDLFRRRRFEHIAEEYRTVCYNQFAPLQTVKNLDLVVSSQAGLDDPLYKTVAIGCHSSCHGAIGFADQTIGGNRSGFNRVLHANEEVGKHAGTQLIFGVCALGADRCSMSIRIDCRLDLRNPASKLTWRSAYRTIGHS